MHAFAVELNYTFMILYDEYDNDDWSKEGRLWVPEAKASRNVKK